MKKMFTTSGCKEIFENLSLWQRLNYFLAVLPKKKKNILDMKKNIGELFMSWILISNQDSDLYGVFMSWIRIQICTVYSWAGSGFRSVWRIYELDQDSDLYGVFMSWIRIQIYTIYLMTADVFVNTGGTLFISKISLFTPE